LNQGIKNLGCNFKARGNKLFALLYFSFSIIALAIATLTDLKERIVSDKINYCLLALGIMLHAAESITSNSPNPLILSISLAAITFGAGLLLWKLGVWAGGDVKLFAALAAMNPLNPNIFGSLTGIELLKTSTLPLFPLSLFIFSVFAMLPYGVLLALRALAKNKEKRKEILSGFKKKAAQLAELSIATIGFGILLQQLGLDVLLVIPILVVLGIVPKQIRVPAIVFVGFFSIAKKQLGFFIEAIGLFAGLFALFAIIKLAAESKSLLNKQKKITELKEGEIVAETIAIKKGKIERLQGIQIGKVINYLKTNNLQALKEMLQPSGKIVCSHRRAAGLEESEIKELNGLVKKGLLEDKIETKQSTAFVPAVLIAYVALNVFGDLIWNIILR